MSDNRTMHRAGRLIAALAVVAAPALAIAPSAHAAGAPEWVVPTPIAYTTTAVEFEVTVGPVGSTITCNVDADLRVPVTATPAHPAPAILTSNGFGGNKSSAGATADNASYAEQYAGQGYVTLSYSGLGFGDSTCPIELDAPAYDGEAGSALVGFLGGDLDGAYSAYTAPTGGNPTGTTPGTWSSPVTTAPPVILDSCDHSVPARCGAADPHDPRVGMIGGSYGGENQFAVASVDPRVDTIVPQITWNDLAFSLAPNNQGAGGDDLAGAGTAPVTQSEAAPGVGKTEWTALFFGEGLAEPTIDGPASGGTSLTCSNFNAQACPDQVDTAATGYPSAATLTFLHTASAGQYLGSIHIPVFLSQGQDDTLFNLREAIDTYETLKAQGTPVKMLWQQWGHSGGPVVGEADGTTPVPELFDDLRYSAWFATYLRGDPDAVTGPAFEYLAPWVADNGTTTTPDTAQYLGAPDYPVGTDQSLYLSGSSPTGTGSLVPSPAAVTPGDVDFTVNPDATSSFTEVSAVDQTSPVVDTPGTFASFSTPPLAANEYQVGSPTLTVNLVAPTFAATEAADPAGQLVLFAKLYDVSPSGTITLANRVISPVRVTDVDQPVTIHLPAIVHEYPAGDTMELVLASSDSAYKENDAAGAVEIADSASSPNVLSIPMTDGIGIGSTPAPPAATPEVALPATLAGLGAAAGWVVLRRRRRSGPSTTAPAGATRS